MKFRMTVAARVSYRYAKFRGDPPKIDGVNAFRIQSRLKSRSKNFTARF